MTDLGDPKDVRARTIESQQAAQKRHHMLQAIMSMPDGREWMQELLERTHPFHVGFSTEPTLMAFQAGERNIGLWLIGDLATACPEFFMQMMKEAGENNGRRDLTDAERDARRAGAGEYVARAQSAGGERPEQQGGRSAAGDASDYDPTAEGGREGGEWR